MLAASNNHQAENHANHQYMFMIGDRGGWGHKYDEATRMELKESFRNKLYAILKNFPTPWTLDLDTLAQLHDIPTLHAIPEQVHRLAITRWLKRVTGQGALCIKVMSEPCCEFRPPHAWRACLTAQIGLGADPKNAKDWTIRAFNKSKDKHEDIPVYIEVAWDCEMTEDGRSPGTGRAPRKAPGPVRQGSA